MKNIFKQKKLKVSVISIAICGAALVGYNAYSNATMTDQERLIQQNLEALTSSESVYFPCLKADLLTCKFDIILASGETGSAEMYGYAKVD